MELAVLLKEISKPINKKEAVALASQNVDSVSQLLKLCSHDNSQMAFRASWILEMVYFLYPKKCIKHLDELICTYVKLKSHSSQRHFTKILMDVTLEAKMSLLAPAQIDEVVDTTFEWMITPNIPVAVKVNCMDILYNLKDRRKWIIDEMQAQIEFQLKYGSAAVQSRGRKVLRKLLNDPIKFKVLSK